MFLHDLSFLYRDHSIYRAKDTVLPRFMKIFRKGKDRPNHIGYWQERRRACDCVERGGKWGMPDATHVTLFQRARPLQRTTCFLYPHWLRGLSRKFPGADNGLQLLLCSLCEQPLGYCCGRQLIPLRLVSNARTYRNIEMSSPSTQVWPRMLKKLELIHNPNGPASRSHLWTVSSGRL